MKKAGELKTLDDVLKDVGKNLPDVTEIMRKAAGLDEPEPISNSTSNYISKLVDEFLAKHQLEHQPGQHSEDSSDSPEPKATKEIVDRFLDSKNTEGLRPYSLNRYGQVLNQFAREFPFLPDRPEVIEKFLASKPSATTRKWIHTIFSGLYKFANSHSGVPNVMEKVPRPITRSKEPDWLTSNQVRSFLEAMVNDRERGLVYLYLGQGLRLSEAIRLDIRDIGEGRLRIKGKEREEFMALLPEVRAALLKLAGDRPITEPVFISYRGRRLGGDMAEIVIKKIFRRAGINGIKQSPHTLRHTFATLATVAGCDTYSVERLLRHRSSGWNVTYRYIHLSIQDLMGKLEKYSPLRTVMGGSSNLLEGQSQRL